MSAAFYQSERYRQSMTAAPLHDEILREVLDVRSIKRKEDYKASSEAYARALDIDKRYGIDAEIKLNNGMVLTLSEKCLSHAQSRHNSLTIEHMQSPSELGDWYSFRADLYMVSYMDDSGEGLEKFVIVSLAALKIADAMGELRWHEGQNQHIGARASFRFIDVRDLFAAAPQTIIAMSGMLDNPAEDRETGQ